VTTRAQHFLLASQNFVLPRIPSQSKMAEDGEPILADCRAICYKPPHSFRIIASGRRESSFLYICKTIARSTLLLPDNCMNCNSYNCTDKVKLSPCGQRCAYDGSE
jgi:hypothetical protein